MTQVSHKNEKDGHRSKSGYAPLISAVRAKRSQRIQAHEILRNSLLLLLLGIISIYYVPKSNNALVHFLMSYNSNHQIAQVKSANFHAPTTEVIKEAKKENDANRIEDITIKRQSIDSLVTVIDDNDFNQLVRQYGGGRIRLKGKTKLVIAGSPVGRRQNNMGQIDGQQ